MSNIYFIWIFIVAGLLVSLNPSVIAIFTSLLAGSLGKGHGRGKFYSVAFNFLLAFWTFTALFGVLFVVDFNQLPVKTLGIVAIITSVALIIWGLWAIKDFFWYKHKGGMPKKFHAVIHQHTTKKTEPHNAVVLGAITASAALINTGLAMVGFAMVSALFFPGVNYWMMLLSLVFTIPLILVFLLTTNGTKLSAIIKWKEDTKQLMRLTVGMTSIVLGWFILLVINGSLGSALL